MTEVWPEKTGTICAQMERGISQQCVASGTMVVTKIIRGGISGTLDASYYKGTGARNGKEREFVAVSIGNGQANNIGMTEQAKTLDCMHDQQIVVHAEKAKRKYIVRRLTPIEVCRLQGFPDNWSDIQHYDDISDEERDFWEKIRKQHAETYGKAYKPFKTKAQMVKWLNGLRTDSAEYKAYGNSVAVPCVEFVMGGIAELIRKEEEEHAGESLP